MSNQGFAPLPIIYLYGRYYFGGYEITLASVQEIRKKFNMPFAAGSSSATSPRLGTHPRPFMREIDAAKALLNDGMIDTVEYTKWKEEYLIKLGNNSDEYRSSVLQSLMCAGLLTRSEASEWMARWENN